MIFDLKHNEIKLILFNYFKKFLIFFFLNKFYELIEKC